MNACLKLEFYRQWVQAEMNVLPAFVNERELSLPNVPREPEIISY